MKLTKFFAMLFAFTALCFTVTSCGDDDTEDDINNFGGINATTAKITKDTANELELTVKSTYFTQVWYAKFNADQKLEKFTMTNTYSSSTYAQAYYSQLDDDDKEHVTINGNTVITDMTEDFAEYDYDRMFIFMESMAKQLNGDNKEQ